MSRSTRLLAAGLAGVAALVTLASPAGAHVSVNPREAEKGGYSKLTFRVPNERPNAGTTQVEINMPPEHPIRSLSVRPTPGWTFVAEKTPLATPMTNDAGVQTTETVSKITWSSGLIAPGEFQEFDVSVGPLPEDADELVFRSLQTYEGGEVVRWIDLETPGGPEPEHPAPVLTLVAGEEEAAASADPAEVGASTDLAASNVASTTDVDDASRNGVIGIVIGAVALLAALAALAMRGKKAGTDTSRV